MGWEGLVGFYSLKSLVPALFYWADASMRLPVKADGFAFKTWSLTPTYRVFGVTRGDQRCCVNNCMIA